MIWKKVEQADKAGRDSVMHELTIMFAGVSGDVLYRGGGVRVTNGYIRGFLSSLLGNEFGRGFVVFFSIVLMLIAPLLIFMLVCYVLYKPRRTTELQSDGYTAGEKPLAILRYEWWRIAWALYFPIVPAIGGCGLATFSPLNATSVLNVIFMKILAPIGLIGFIWLMADMILMKEVRLYRDRIVKSYLFFTAKEILFSGAMYNFTDSLFARAFGMRNANSQWFLSIFKAVTIWNLNLCKSVDVNRFIAVLSEISGRNTKELTNNTWKPIRFIKKDATSV